MAADAAREAIAGPVPGRCRATNSGVGVPKRDGGVKIGPVRRAAIERARVSLYRWVGSDLELAVHARPGARRTQVHGIHGEAIRIRIAARAIEGAANEALLEFLAEALQVPRRRCVLISGASSRNKRVRIESPDRARAEHMLAHWLQTRS